MIQKHPICPNRIRTIPQQFSWVDHRLVRDHHIERCGHAAAALYLFLVTVADAKGLSYYGDQTIARRLDMNAQTLASARSQLVQIDLIAFQKPLYQVLSLEPTHHTQREQNDQIQTLGQILNQIKAKAT